MKVVITGKDSYIGNHIETWLKSHNDDCEVEQLDVQSDDWERYDFCGADTVIHVAGIVHKPKLKDEQLYTRVNVELPFKIATKAKACGVKQFIFFSTMAVYGKNKALRPNKITEGTSLLPVGLYGKSKYAAELKISCLTDESFTVCIVRPPNVYGAGCKGNYVSGFLKLTNLPIPFPYAFTDVKQSMIYIDNLCEAIRIIVEKRLQGIYCPSDRESVSAVDLVRAISAAEGKKKRFSKFLGFFVKVFGFLPIVRKIYGGVEYDMAENGELGDYCVIGFDQAINKTLNNGETF